MMKPVAMVLAAVVVAAFLAAIAATETRADSPQADRVVAMYFHRTQRCPTCLKMGGYSEEALSKAFAQQLKEGKVAFYYVDFQNPKNAALTKGYGVSGPALVLAKVRGGKLAEFKNLKDIWAKAGDKPAFLKYVRENVTAYLP